MDTLTHTVLGACAGELLGGKKLGKKAMLWGAIANNLPDIDVITSWWMNQPDSLLAHRGFTHSIVFAVSATFIFGWLLRKTHPSSAFSRNEWTRLVGINIFLHILIDAFTSYGTGWFEPFSHLRISFNLLFVADPFFTISLVIGAILLLVLRTNSKIRTGVARSAVLISFIYFAYALYHKYEVNEIVSASLEKRNLSQADFMATPAPLNNFLWYVVAPADSGFMIGYYSVFDKTKDIDFNFMPSNKSLLSTLKEDEDVNKLIRFSQGFYIIEQINDTLIFDDLRFGQVGGWTNGNAPFVFQYKLAKNYNNDIVIQKGRMKASGGKALREMIERIRGK